MCRLPWPTWGLLSLSASVRFFELVREVYLRLSLAEDEPASWALLPWEEDGKEELAQMDSWYASSSASYISRMVQSSKM